MTGHCVGSARIIKGKLDAEIGGCQFTNRGGDTYYTAYTTHGTDTPEVVVTKGSYVGGSGKYAGITGSYEARRHALPAPGEGRGASVSFAKGTYSCLERMAATTAPKAGSTPSESSDIERI